nr:ribosomal protein L32 [Echinothamnion sp.]
MAVPKKRTSKSKSRKANWRKKALFVSQKSLSLAKSLLKDKSTTFIYNESLDDYKLTQII